MKMKRLEAGTGYLRASERLKPASPLVTGATCRDQVKDPAGEFNRINPNDMYLLLKWEEIYQKYRQASKSQHQAGQDSLDIFFLAKHRYPGDEFCSG